MDESRDLLKSVRNTIKHYADGEINFNQAQQEYQNLLNYYQNLLNTVEPNDEYFLRGLFYHHNCENFSKLTALCIVTDGVCKIIEFYGDNNLFEIIQNKMSQVTSGQDDKGNHKDLLTEQEGLEYYLYYKNITNIDTTMFCLTVTSSLYFQEEYFSYLVQIVKKLYYNYNNLSQLTFINFIEFFTNQFQNYLRSSHSNMIYADIFIFDSIGAIFGHMGNSELINISNTICDTLSNYFHTQHKLFIFSSVTYIVINEKRDSALNKVKKSKPYFVYNDITLPYKHLELKINNDQSVYKFIDELYVFENYIKSGDK